jgi:hypothetical protein
MADFKIIKNYCSECKRYTNSKILFSHTHREDDDGFGFEEIYKVVECCGCERIRFRFETTNDSMVHEEDGQYCNYYDVENYPLHLENGYKPLTYLHLLPTRIRTVYTETIQALKVKSYLLAAVGFRTIIEAICIENEIKGSLEAKIKNLAKTKLITEKEESRLHSIRFLGNDSVHEMLVPDETKLFIVLDIVEHLLKNLYIIDNASKSLDMVIDTFNEFESLVWKMVKTLETDQEKSMREILGKHIRRLGNRLPEMEAQLVAVVRSGNTETVKLGKVMQIEGQMVQYYLRGDHEEFDLADF